MANTQTALHCDAVVKASRLSSVSSVKSVSVTGPFHHAQTSRLALRTYAVSKDETRSLPASDAAVETEKPWLIESSGVPDASIHAADSVSPFYSSLNQPARASSSVHASSRASLSNDQQPYLRSRAIAGVPGAPRGAVTRTGQMLSQPESLRGVQPIAKGSEQPPSRDLNPLSPPASISGTLMGNGDFWQFAAEAVEREKASAQKETEELRATAAAAAERSQFLLRQFSALKEKEAKAKEVAKVATGKLQATEKEMAAMKVAHEQEVAQLQATVAQLQGQVVSLKAELTASASSASAAKERASFLLRQLERVKASQAAATGAVTTAGEASVTAEAAVQLLKDRVAQLEARDAAAKNLLRAAEQRLMNVSLELSASQRREERVAGALTIARGEVTALERKLGALQVQLQQATVAPAGSRAKQGAATGSALLAVAGAAASKSAEGLAKLMEEVAGVLERTQKKVAVDLEGSAAQKAEEKVVIDAAKQEAIASASNLREAVTAVHDTATLSSISDVLVFDKQEKQAVPSGKREEGERRYQQQKRENFW